MLHPHRTCAASANSTLVIDYTLASGDCPLTFELLESPHTPAVRLFAGQKQFLKTSCIACTVNAAPGISVPSIARTFDDLRLTAKTRVVFGAANDPIDAASGRLAASLHTLELLAESGFAELILQTRSPLALLASPVLRSLGDRARIVIALETLDDALAMKLTPHLPRPTERLLACRALAHAGFRIELQVAPIVCRGSSQSSLGPLAACLLELDGAVRVIGTGRVFTPPSIPASSSENRLRRMVRADAHRLLRNELIKLEHHSPADVCSRQPEAA